jgi:hypothetical protein
MARIAAATRSSIITPLVVPGFTPYLGWRAAYGLERDEGMEVRGPRLHEKTLHLAQRAVKVASEAKRCCDFHPEWI